MNSACMRGAWGKVLRWKEVGACGKGRRGMDMVQEETGNEEGERVVDVCGHAMGSEGRVAGILFSGRQHSKLWVCWKRVIEVPEKSTVVAA
eukprot:7492916-Prorocentrum_lima.AAC.1